jgi:hypothetical protein
MSISYMSRHTAGGWKLLNARICGTDVGVDGLIFFGFSWSAAFLGQGVALRIELIHSGPFLTTNGGLDCTRLVLRRCDLWVRDFVLLVLDVPRVHSQLSCFRPGLKCEKRNKVIDFSKQSSRT